MNAWLESLEELFDKTYLDEFDEIYYLNSTKMVDKSVIEKASSDQKLKDFLVKNESDSHEDLLDFFLLVNDESQTIIAIYSPFDLMEEENVFISLSNIEEDFSDLESIELVK